MKIVSFNVNGIRARLHQLEALTEIHSPDIIGIQEIKCANDAFPAKAIEEMGYHAEVFGQKGHYGVAILSKQAPTNVEKGFPEDDPKAQRRFIAADFAMPDGQSLKLINGYFPQGESRDHPLKFPAKEKYYDDLLAYMNNHCDTKNNLLIIGDMNVAPEDKDVGIGDTNAKRWLRTGKCCFLPEEREWLAKITEWGTYDIFRELNPETDDLFSWFDYRSRGFDDNPKRGLRIDLLLGSNSMLKKCKSVGIDYNIRGMEKPSDHAPVWAVFA